MISHPVGTGSGNRTSQRGFSLLEATVATLLVGLVFVAAVQTLAVLRWRTISQADRNRAQVLAWELMSEILSKAYEEPQTVTTSLGPEAPETSLGRPAFDDVDDYAGWSQSPPTTPDGIPQTELQGWTMSVSVAWVDPADMRSVRSEETGMKHVEVTVCRGQMVLARLLAYRSRASAQAQGLRCTPTDNRPPIILASVDPLEASPGQAVRFDAQGSLDPDGDTLTYLWKFSDGQVVSGASIARAFASAGVYSVRLEVQDGRGGLATRQWILRITSTP